MKKSICIFVIFMMITVLGLSSCAEANGNTENKTNIDELVDFVLTVEEGKEFRVLQLTDTQIIDPGQSRYPERINNTTPISDEELYSTVFYYIEQAIKRTQPDLIIMTGDLVYGEFDDSGESLRKLVSYMESFEIPWAPIFGNHDNESAMGVTWQCDQFVNAEHCLFKRGDRIGNGNYTIGIQQGDKLIKVIYMVDSNGCTYGRSYHQMGFPPYNEGEKLMTVAGITEDQVEWIDETSSYITGALHYSPSKFLAFHIPTIEFSKAAEAKGYQSSDSQKTFVIKDATNEDFGNKNEAIRGIETPYLWAVMKKHNVDGVFVGHNHTNNFSIVYEGIRLTCGLKTGTHDRSLGDMLGGTLITVAAGGESFQVEHIYVTPTAQ